MSSRKNVDSGAEDTRPPLPDSSRVAFAAIYPTIRGGVIVQDERGRSYDYQFGKIGDIDRKAQEGTGKSKATEIRGRHASTHTGWSLCLRLHWKMVTDTKILSLPRFHSSRVGTVGRFLLLCC